MSESLFAIPDPKRIDYAKQHARSYPTPAGNRLNRSAIVLKFKIAPWCFTGWQERGWPTLKGKSLESVPMPLGYYGRTEPTFLESEVEATLPRLPILVGQGQ